MAQRLKVCGLVLAHCACHCTLLVPAPSLYQEGLIKNLDPIETKEEVLVIVYHNEPLVWPFVLYETQDCNLIIAPF
ncbi:hypothetical protein RO3G_15850 [Rhizopus delemar RA 99-880]|uniref:Uncharacterized protein n=1 Tax=Rhizopus delemar (strain RA 99-880 / ATCC MYA-4621 / FGSC 9543 / NRRL 43880) TaxID=246409 RepID=I1CRQ9_RHIO9|nr:hypothetical protein RO3G_15850 [Rhizopus delemar RA 99-880]|eukprot:EIE91139.1 hypothetical protein RO3G_15850 [Rhizopus delemar RA 99-880]